jgi:2-C-methyl-D-erythritol 2,4-cyclodiphosphate synthase
MLKIGIGYDSHTFVEGIPLVLGGVQIEHPMGLKGHSDGDVIIHAIIDAIVSPTLNKSIGDLFPNTDIKYKGISSLLLLEETYKLITRAFFKIVNIDVTFIAEEPIIMSYTLKMRDIIAHSLNLDSSNISIKGKSNEKMGFIGRHEGAVAMAVALLYSDKHIA